MKVGEWGRETFVKMLEAKLGRNKRDCVWYPKPREEESRKYVTPGTGYADVHSSTYAR
jgi:hypothetical protein